MFFLMISCGNPKLEIENSPELPEKVYSGPLLNGDTLLSYVRTQLDFGPRNPGSKGHSACKDFLLSYFSSRADSSFLQTFKTTVYGKTYEMANIIAAYSPEKEERILLCAHWDTRPFADEDKDASNRTTPILGANDGASGVAVLMGIAETLSKNKPDIGIDIILFDGEDIGLSGDQDGFFQGSRYAAKHYPMHKPKYGILLDLVGDKDAEFRFEPISQQAHSVLVDKIWSIAKKQQSPFFLHEVGNAVSDDHVMLNEHGIRTINIIDVNLVGNISTNPRRRYWHTADDNLSNISGTTMSNVGNILLDFLFTSSDSVY
jgi:glutaminyl-peptide cyclotransferase